MSVPVVTEERGENKSVADSRRASEESSDPAGEPSVDRASAPKLECGCEAPGENEHS